MQVTGIALPLGTSTYLFIENGKVVGSYTPDKDFVHPAEAARGYRDGAFPNATVVMVVGGEDELRYTKANCQVAA